MILKHPKKSLYYHEWDWKEQPSWGVVSTLAAKGFKGFNEVETGSDSYAILITKKLLNHEDAQALFVKEYASTKAPDWDYIEYNDL